MEARKMREVTISRADGEKENIAKAGKQDGEMKVRRVDASYLVVKRCFDFLSSLIMSIILLIPLAVLALLVVVKDFGNPFYVQKRVGQNGKELRVANLRWMKLWCNIHKGIGRFSDCIYAM